VRVHDKFLTRARLWRGGNIHGSWTHPGQLPSRAPCTIVARPLNTHPAPILAHFHLHGCRQGSIGASFGTSHTATAFTHDTRSTILFSASQRHSAWTIRFEKRDTIRKQPGALKTNWPILSACHAGRLADHRTPVGFVDL
jgi:hypothetical protein